MEATVARIRAYDRTVDGHREHVRKCKREEGT